ncbi:MAG: hypothetical protein ACYTF6_03580 [Planctomycetota bacterium]|jgi:hypothetical protein
MSLSDKDNRDVRHWYDDEVLPFLGSEFPELMSEMSIQVKGSFARGCDRQRPDVKFLAHALACPLVGHIIIARNVEKGVQRGRVI